MKNNTNIINPENSSNIDPSPLLGFSSRSNQLVHPAQTPAAIKSKAYNTALNYALLFLAVEALIKFSMFIVDMQQRNDLINYQNRIEQDISGSIEIVNDLIRLYKIAQQQPTDTHSIYQLRGILQRMHDEFNRIDQYIKKLNLVPPENAKYYEYINLPLKILGGTLFIIGVVALIHLALRTQKELAAVPALQLPNDDADRITIVDAEEDDPEYSKLEEPQSPKPALKPI